MSAVVSALPSGAGHREQAVADAFGLSRENARRHPAFKRKSIPARFTTPKRRCLLVPDDDRPRRKSIPARLTTPKRRCRLVPDDDRPRTRKVHGSGAGRGVTSDAGHKSLLPAGLFKDGVKEGMRIASKIAFATIAIGSDSQSQILLSKRLWKQFSSAVDHLPPFPSKPFIDSFIPSVFLGHAASELVQPLSVSAPIAKGFKSWVGRLCYKPDQILSVFGLESDQWQSKNSSDQVENLLRTTLVQKGFTVLAIEARSYPSDSRASSSRWMFMSRIAFEMGTTRTLVIPIIKALELRQVPRCYMCFPPLLVRKVFTSACRVGIPSVLSECHTHRLGSLTQYHLLLVLWVDNCDAQTAVRFRLIDPQRLLFPTGLSKVCLLMEYIGGEEMLPMWFPEVLEDMLQIKTAIYSLQHVSIRVRFAFMVADHHALGILSCIPQGISDFRDSLGLTVARWWSIVHDDGTSTMRVSDLVSKYNSSQHLYEMIVHYLGKDKSATKPTDTQIREVAQKYCSVIYGKINLPPLLARHRTGGALSVSTCPPPMHDVFHVIQTTMQLVFMYAIPKESYQHAQFVSWVGGLQDLVKQGKIIASMARARRIAVSCPGFFEDIIKSSSEWSVYFPVLRLLAWITRHLYSPAESTPKRRLRFRLCGFLLWLLIGDLSARVGGRHMKNGSKKSHVENVYWKDLTQHMPRFEETFRLSLYHLNEESFEQSFKAYKLFAEKVHKATALEGERIYRGKVRAREKLLKSVPRRNLWKVYEEIPYQVITVCPGINSFLSRSLQVEGSSIPVGPTMWRKFLTDVFKIDMMADMVNEGSTGIMKFSVGSSYSTEDIPLRVCFCHKPPADTNNISCGCSSGGCKKCKCSKNGSMCTPRCGCFKFGLCSRPFVQPLPTLDSDRCKFLDDHDDGKSVPLASWVSRRTRQTIKYRQTPSVDL